jgi:hypothetical protein
MSDGSPVSLRNLFRHMPDSIIPYLTTNNRLDMLDFWDSGMHVGVKNNLDGRSELKALSDSCLTVQLNESSRFEMILLDCAQPVDSSYQLLCTIYHFGTDSIAPVRGRGIHPCQSVIRFYSARWSPLSADDFLVIPTDGQSMTDSYTAKWIPRDNMLQLTMRCSLDVPANEEQTDLEETLVNLKWDGKTFKKL